MVNPGDGFRARPTRGSIDSMCRNIKILANYAPPATPDEVHAAALQYVRKVSGATKPSAANQHAVDHAVAAIARTTQELLDAMVTSAPPKDREVEAAKARARNAVRFGNASGVGGVTRVG
jgi:hypothetical protein